MNAPDTPGVPLELVDVLDEHGSFVRRATRAEVRAANLRHRTVFIMVMTTDEQLVVHRRAGWKDVYAGFWDVAFGGVVGAGEDFHDAAVRELAEEAGIEAPLVYLGEDRYDAPDGREVARIYRAEHDGPYTCPDGEVAEIDVVAVAHLATWLTQHEVCPDSIAVVVPRIEGACQTMPPPFTTGEPS